MSEPLGNQANYLTLSPPTFVVNMFSASHSHKYSSRRTLFWFLTKTIPLVSDSASAGKVDGYVIISWCSNLQRLPLQMLMYEDRVGVFLLISLCRVCSYLSKSHWYSWLFVIANIWSKPTWRSVQIDQNSELSVELGWSSQKLTKLTVHKLYQLFYRIKWLILNWNIFTICRYVNCFLWNVFDKLGREP